MSHVPSQLQHSVRFTSVSNCCWLVPKLDLGCFRFSPFAAGSQLRQSMAGQGPA